MIEILEEPIGITYRSLVSLAFEVCNNFTLVKRDQLPLNHSGKKLLTELKPYIIDINKQDNWPGTRLLGHYADVHYIRCCKETKEILLDRVESLYSWMQPNLLEDLCFYKDETEWLITVAHEGMGYIDTTLRDEILRLREIEGLLFY
ncbi:hypothetical protein BHU72_01700 [Desulfuribacillus stibiiarsenatis]|uniref:Uncharacterized protein n=1 Tax=Desulfuribacillus stibiiarsenatis TaxID=1390249 RepID=A0A1E5LA44_9FIRM|nr:hypothetical protein [Desulfuribacillus stibiiarsenatis]OEH86996.1 hypothetical protein BHU72_01700 [Desulfuribacillus stibiiarsenatis]